MISPRLGTRAYWIRQMRKNPNDPQYEIDEMPISLCCGADMATAQEAICPTCNKECKIIDISESDPDEYNITGLERFDSAY